MKVRSKLTEKEKETEKDNITYTSSLSFSHTHELTNGNKRIFFGFSLELFGWAFDLFHVCRTQVLPQADPVQLRYLSWYIWGSTSSTFILGSCICHSTGKKLVYTHNKKAIT